MSEYLGVTAGSRVMDVQEKIKIPFSENTAITIFLLIIDNTLKTH